MAGRTREQIKNETFSVIYTLGNRDGQDNQNNWQTCSQAIDDREKGWHESRLGQLSLNLASTPSTVGVTTEKQNVISDDQVEVERVIKTYPFTPAGRKAVLDLLSLTGIDDAFSLIQDPSEEVLDAKRVLWDTLVAQQSDKPVRLHYLTNAETLESAVNYVTSSKFKTFSEKVLFSQVQALCQADTFDYELRRFVIDDDGIRFQVIQRRNPVDDPSQPGGKFYGLIDFQISETRSKNTVNLGFWQDECENGCLFHQDEALSINVGNSNRMSMIHLLEAAFKAIESATYNRVEKLAIACQLPFEFSHKALVASLSAQNNVTRVFEKELSDKLDAWLEQNASQNEHVSKHTLADVVNEITRIGHSQSLSVQDQLRLERVGGAVLTGIVK